MYAFLAKLFGGPSPVIVTCIVLVALAAAATVFWMLVRLVVDPRARLSEDEHSQPDAPTPGDASDKPGYAFQRGDGTG